MKRRVTVFATGTDWVQVVWRGAGHGSTRLEVAGRVVEVDPIATSGAVTVGDLEPSTEIDVVLGGRRVARATTLSRPSGQLLSRVATVSDLHIGETGTGHFPRLKSAPTNDDWADAHPVWCLEAAVDELVKYAPDAVVVKGDIAHRNRLEEYQLAVPMLQRVPAPILAIGGNHDGGNEQRAGFEAAMTTSGLPVAPVQTLDLDGVRVVAADTRVPGHHSGQIAPVLDDLIAAAAAADGRAVLVMLHHQLMTTRYPYYIPTGVPKDQAEMLCRRLAGTTAKVAVSSGHTHRNRVRHTEGVLVTEVGSPKDYPGVWAAYEIYEGGLVQTVRRIEAPNVLAWTDLTATTAGGVWRHWAPGRLGDRCVSVSW